MKRWYYIVLGAIIFVGSTYVYLHRAELGFSEPFQSGSGPGAASAGLTPAHITWANVDRSPQGFTVNMPARSLWPSKQGWAKAPDTWLHTNHR